MEKIIGMVSASGLVQLRTPEKMNGLLKQASVFDRYNVPPAIEVSNETFSY